MKPAREPTSRIFYNEEPGIVASAAPRLPMSRPVRSTRGSRGVAH
jgi:hypothetical protein